MNEQVITDSEVDRLYERLNKEAEAAGYHLNPDVDFVKELVKSLLINDNRYGYKACPCRLASGNKKEDLDIICPCDYRDPDLNEYSACYCAMYVSKAIVKGEKKAEPIPERRTPPGEKKKEAVEAKGHAVEVPETVWRCRVCGYLCAREEPPGVCPICKADKERFEVFLRPSRLTEDDFHGKEPTKK